MSNGNLNANEAALLVIIILVVLLIVLSNGSSRQSSKKHQAIPTGSHETAVAPKPASSVQDKEIPLSMRTIRDSKAGTGEQLDPFETETDKLQATLGDLLAP